MYSLIGRGPKVVRSITYKENLHIMSQENMSGKIGKSSSPMIQRIIENNKNVQAPVAVPAIIKNSFQKTPVKS